MPSLKPAVPSFRCSERRTCLLATYSAAQKIQERILRTIRNQFGSLGTSKPDGTPDRHEVYNYLHYILEILPKAYLPNSNPPIQFYITPPVANLIGGDSFSCGEVARQLVADYIQSFTHVQGSRVSLLDVGNKECNNLNRIPLYVGHDQIGCVDAPQELHTIINITATLVTQKLVDIYNSLDKRKMKEDLEKVISELHKLAYTDTLTMIPNRRAVIEKGEEIAESEDITSVLMFDIDHFKSINDTYGHEVGDRALRYFAHALQEFFGRDTLLGRIGGEEFLVILPVNIPTAFSMAEGFQSYLRQNKETGSVYDREITTSIGVTGLSNISRENHGNKTGAEIFSEAMGRADLALYSAKSAGRDKVYIYDGPSFHKRGADERRSVRKI